MNLIPGCEVDFWHGSIREAHLVSERVKLALYPCAPARFSELHLEFRVRVMKDALLTSTPTFSWAESRRAHARKCFEVVRSHRLAS